MVRVMALMRLNSCARCRSSSYRRAFWKATPLVGQRGQQCLVLGEKGLPLCVVTCSTPTGQAALR